MQNQLAEFKLGRIVLHLLCSCQDKNFPWHWRGIVREFRKEPCCPAHLKVRCDREML
jgi:hypothetical protein